MGAFGWWCIPFPNIHHHVSLSFRAEFRSGSPVFTAISTAAVSHDGGITTGSESKVSLLTITLEHHQQ